MDPHVKLTMALTAENLAVKHNISREDCDQYALQSQQRWKAGWYREKNVLGGGGVPPQGNSDQTVMDF